MVKRKQIGLIYDYREGWIAGAYYIENVIKALNILPDAEKPFIIIYTYTNEFFRRIAEKTHYPYLEFFCTNIRYSLLERIINKISRNIIKRNIINKLPKQNSVDWVFPNPYYLFNHFNSEKKIYWIPDFQEEHLPQFFSSEEIKNRKNWQRELASDAKYIVFSSNDALKDFNNLYKCSKVNRIVIPFAVIFDGSDINNETINDTLEKYGINREYFIIPNQLWVHKNHKTVLKSIELFNKQPYNIQFIFTGKEKDYRFPDFPKELKKMVDNLNIQNNTKFLGFIPRKDLDILIDKAKAIIQPSLFEGWSTTIEEAKMHNKFIIASNIDIHKEQLIDYPNKVFFDKLNYMDLADKLLKTKFIIKEYNYEKNINSFVKSLLQINRI